MSANETYFTRAKLSIPGGVKSPVRAYGSVGGTPRFMVSARGPYITDAIRLSLPTGPWAFVGVAVVLVHRGTHI